MKFIILTLLIVTRNVYNIECGTTIYGAAVDDYDAADLKFTQCQECGVTNPKPAPGPAPRPDDPPKGADSCANPHVGHYVDSSTGIVTPCTAAHCVSCPTDLCDRCASGYLLESAGKTCLQLPGCADHGVNSVATTLDAECKSCTGGYYMDANSACVECTTGCLTCSGAGACEDVAPGFFKTANSSPEACATGCVTCSAAGTCDTIAPGYRKKADNTPEVCTLEKCALCEADIATCTDCMDGYVLFTPPEGASEELEATCVKVGKDDIADFVKQVMETEMVKFNQIVSIAATSIIALLNTF